MDREIFKVYGGNKSKSRMNRGPFNSQTLPEYLRELEKRSEEVLERARQLREADGRTSKISGRTYRQKTRITGVNPMNMPEAAARIAEAHNRMREVTSALLAGPKQHEQRKRITGTDQLNVCNDLTRGIGPSSAANVSGSETRDINRTAQENGESVTYAALGRVQERSPGRKGSVEPLTYWQKTKITGNDHLAGAGNANVSGGRAGGSGRGVTQVVRPRSVDGYESGQYWQKTKITGNDNLLNVVSDEDSELGDWNLTVWKNREPDLDRALGSTETTGLLGSREVSSRLTEAQLSEVRTKLGIRTSMDIFETMQREYEEDGVGRPPKRRRVQGPGNAPFVEDGVNVQARKTRRIVGGEERDQREERTEWEDWDATDEGIGSEERLKSQEEKLGRVLSCLEEEFAEKERLSQGGLWCIPIPHDMKVSTVVEFYNAFHDGKTLPIRTCAICYRKFGEAELEEAEWAQWKSSSGEGQHLKQLDCRMCFHTGGKVVACKECVKNVGRGIASPAVRLHSRLRCEHAFPEELKDLTPVEEKLIALNSCYGFITTYSVVKGRRQSTAYPKHIKGHITVFPNCVQELVTLVLPHPLLKVMDEIHVSWKGPQKPAPKDISGLLSVRRRVVERALVWLKANNPLYAHIEIDTAELESWGAPSHGVPCQVYERLERDEPSAVEKTRTAQLVPPSERGLEVEDAMDVREILATLDQADVGRLEGVEEGRTDVGNGDAEPDGNVNESDEAIQEIGASGMFALDANPDVDDAEKLQYVFSALGNDGKGRSSSSAEVLCGNTTEPYIAVSRGEDFADPDDMWFYAKAFPTLFPFGGGGPRQAEEKIAEMVEGLIVESPMTAEALAKNALSSRNMSLEKWARVVLQRHGGRFATHRVFTFLVFNKLVRFRNHRVSMMSVSRKEFPEVERIVQSLSVQRLENARHELEASGKTSDGAVNQLLRNLSLYGFRQPMSRELRLGMRRKIKSLIVREGIPAIWFTLNPNDITNPVKLRLAAYRSREPKEAEAFLTGLDASFKRMRLAISDPLSSALFFHREISMFFKHYVRAGESSVFGRINQYFAAVETNERGSLHLHGLLWLHGNIGLSSFLDGVEDEGSRSYRDQVLQYVDSVFTEVCPHPSLPSEQSSETELHRISMKKRLEWSWPRGRPRQTYRRCCKAANSSRQRSRKKPISAQGQRKYTPTVLRV
jgi:hypothetical protein